MINKWKEELEQFQEDFVDLSLRKAMTLQK